MIAFVFETFKSEDNSKFLEKLYNDNKSWMHFRAFKHLGNMEISEDIVQDVFLKLGQHVEKLKTFNEAERRAYMAVSVDNAVKNYRRAQSRTVTAFDSDGANLEYVADSYSVEKEVEEKFEYDALRSCYMELDERDKELIMMKYDLALSDEQIADVIHVKKDSVRMTVRRSMLKLREKVLKKVNE